MQKRPPGGRGEGTRRKREGTKKGYPRASLSGKRIRRRLFLDLDLFLHDNLSLVGAALGAYPVGHDIDAAPRAGPQVGESDGVMGPSHSRFRLGFSSLW